MRKNLSLSSDGLIFIVAVSAHFIMATYLGTFSVLGFINTLDQRWVMIFGVITFPILFLGILGDLFNRKLLWLSLFLAIIFLVIIPTIVSMYLRHNSKPYLFVHDNPIQVEESIKFILSGKNPYTEDYFQTSLPDWQYGPPVYSFKPVRPPESYFINPSIYHHVALPFGPLSILPFYIVWNSIFGWFDARIFYLSAYILLLFLSVKLVKPVLRFSFLALFALNPFFATAILEGHNDVLTILLIVAGLIFAKNKKYLLSAIPFGLVLVTKQSGWVFFAVYLIFLLYKAKTFVKKVALISLSIAAVFSTPFLLWDFKSFFEDTILYVSGGLATSYPISGNGFSSLLLTLGILRTSLVYYPAWIFEIIFGLPVLILCIRMLKRSPTIKVLVLSYSLLLFVVLFFSRFFVTSYFGVLVQFLVLGYFIQDPDS